MENALVLKFGGAAVRSLIAIDRVAEIIALKREEKRRVVVVVSAMANMTDELLFLARSVHPEPPKRELDMLISVGERVSMSLLAMALAKRNVEAISFTGSQSGIITDHEHTEAKILDVRPRRIQHQLEQDKVVIVAGFQGVSQLGEITTLGRGGGDTTAVALAIALGAKEVEFFKDVRGIFDRDPKKYKDAVFYPQLSYRKALQIGGGILHMRAILLAEKNALPLHVRTFQSMEGGTLIQEPKDTSLNRAEFEVATC